MVSEINNLTNEIAKFNEGLSKYEPKLESIKLYITEEIINEQKKSDDIIKKTYAEQTKFTDLISKSNRLKMDIKNYNTQITSLEHKKSNMELEEGNLDDLIAKVEQETQKLSKLKIELELIGVETESATIKLTESNEEIAKLNSGKSSLINSNAQLVSSAAESNNKHKMVEQKLKSLRVEQESEERKLTDIGKNLSIEENSLLEKQKESKKVIIELEELDLKKKLCDKQSETAQAELAKMKIDKEIIVVEYENERKKLRNEENRIIAIKKDVLRFILEYKDAGNKSQIAKFAQRVENAT